MKPPSELDHYEILEARRDASAEEIDRSYRLARVTYADDSLAGYSVLEVGDAEAMQERIEVAFRVLSDRELRREYDAELSGDFGALPLDAIAPEPELESTAPPAVERDAPIDDFEDLEPGSGDFDGNRLRRARLRCGLDLEDIAGVTKISPTYLRFLEEEQFSELPAPVYVRGFITAYASCVGLDGRRAATSYMKRFDSKHAGRRRGRFFEGR